MAFKEMFALRDKTETMEITWRGKDGEPVDSFVAETPDSIDELFLRIYRDEVEETEPEQSCYNCKYLAVKRGQGKICRRKDDKPISDFDEWRFYDNCKLWAPDSN